MCSIGSTTTATHTSRASTSSAYGDCQLNFSVSTRLSSLISGRRSDRADATFEHSPVDVLRHAAGKHERRDEHVRVEYCPHVRPASSISPRTSASVRTPTARARAAP